MWQNTQTAARPVPGGDCMRQARALGVVLLLATSTAAAQDELQAICTDRPTKSTGTCTADAGHLQIEADLASFSELKLAGSRSSTLLVLNPTLKFGLSPRLDVELNGAAYVQMHSHDGSGNHTVRGSGDLYFNLKQKLYTGAVLEVALMPLVKAPTARRALGNGAWEGGVLLPLVARLSDEWSLNLSPELDRKANADGGGHHWNTAQLVNLGRTLAHQITVSAELWADWDSDPGGGSRQVSFDVGGAWLLSRDLQLDGGVNLGLNRVTPGVQAYLGLSERF